MTKSMLDVSQIHKHRNKAQCKKSSEQRCDRVREPDVCTEHQASTNTQTRYMTRNTRCVRQTAEIFRETEPETPQRLHHLTGSSMKKDEHIRRWSSERKKCKVDLSFQNNSICLMCEVFFFFLG